MLEIIAEPLDVGTVLAGTYRLERVLGSGGMGVVWAAKELASDRDVALKVLADDRATDPTQHARLLREAAAAMKIDHPNVVKVSAVLETDSGAPFLVMERLEGESLRAKLLRSGKVEVDECLALFHRIIDGVAAAHTAGILHRDLKPENVFLLRDGGLKVLDFGIAKRLNREALASASASLTETGAVIGTPHYMAPEQIFGDEDVDARADIWSLGVMLYECLAGERPTEAEGFGQILKRITTEPIEPLAKAQPGLPPRLTELVGRMLSRERTERPSLDDVLASFANIDAPLTKTVDIPPRRRWPFAVAAGAVIVAGAATFTRATTKESPAEESDAMSLLTAASRHQAQRDGAACLKDLDTFDHSAARGKLPVSTDLTSGYAGVRSTCMMLMGNCDEGRKLYRAWLPVYSQPMDAGLYDQAADSIVTQFCIKH